MTTLRFVGRRLLFALIGLLLTSVAIFSLLHIAPGEPERAVNFASPQLVPPEFFAAVREHFGLDKPIPAQYFTFLGNIVHFDFGTSFVTSEPVTEVIKDKLGVTGPLVLMALIIAMVIAMPLAAVASIRRGTVIDRSSQNLALVLLSAPAFAVATILIYVFAVRLQWFPPFGEGDGFTDRIYHLILPAISLGSLGVALIFTNMRSRLIANYDEDYVTFANARGVSRSRVFYGYVFRNSMITLITVSSVTIINMLSAAVVVEVVFGLDGMGALLATAVQKQDIPVVQGLALIVAVLVIIINTVAELLYFAADARVRAREATQAQ